MNFPSPQRMTHEIKDVDRSTHKLEAENNLMRKMQAEVQERSLNLGKEINNNKDKLTELAVTQYEEQRKADIERMNAMSEAISGLSEKLFDTKNQIKKLRSAVEDQNVKNDEREQGLLSQIEGLKQRNKALESVVEDQYRKNLKLEQSLLSQIEYLKQKIKELEIMFAVLNQNQGKLHELFPKVTNELSQHQILVQKGQENSYRELRGKLEELLHQNHREYETLRSDLKMMDQSVYILDKSLTVMMTRVDEIERNGQEEQEGWMKYIEESTGQSVKELKDGLARLKNILHETVKGLEEKLEEVKKENANPVASEGPIQLPQQMRPASEPYQLQASHPPTVTDVQYPQHHKYFISGEGPHDGTMNSTSAPRPSDTSTIIPPGHSGIYEEGDTPTRETKVQEQQGVGSGPDTPPRDPREFLITQERLPQTQFFPTARPVKPKRGMTTIPVQMPSRSGQHISAGPSQSASAPLNIGQRMEGSSFQTVYPSSAYQKLPWLPVFGVHPESNLSIPSTIAPRVSPATPSSQFPTHQPVPSAGSAESPCAGFSLKGTPGGDASHPTSQVTEQTVFTSSPPKLGEDTTVQSGRTLTKPSVGQQKSGVLNISVRRQGESIMSAIPQTHDREDVTQDATITGPASQTPSSFGDIATSDVSLISISDGGDADPSQLFSQFTGPRTTVFEGRPTPTPQTEEDIVSEDQEYDSHYEPITSLPENVDLTTGDEGEDVIFKERAKLYRYDSDTQKWKERGVGDMKILKNPETGRIRILMRREQVLKVCANHLLTPDMELRPMSSLDRAWVWRAVDFAEGEVQHVLFAVKFQKHDHAAKFKKIFDAMKEETGQGLTQLPDQVDERPSEPDQDKLESLTKELGDDSLSQDAMLGPYSGHQNRRQEKYKTGYDSRKRTKEKEETKEKDGEEKQQPTGDAGIIRQQEIAPAVSDIREEGNVDRDGKDKAKDLSEEKPEDMTDAVKSKETVITPSELPQDVKTDEEDGVKETGNEGETCKEKQEDEEEKEPVPAFSDKREAEDVARKEEDKVKDLSEEKPQDMTAAVKSIETVITPSELTQDVKTKEEDGVKNTEKEGENWEEKQEEKEEQEPVPAVSDIREVRNVSREDENEVKDLSAEEKPEEMTAAEESKKSVVKPSELTQDEKTKEENGVKKTGKEGGTWVEKQEEKEEKEPVPAFSNIKEAGDVDREEEDKVKDLSAEEKPEDMTAAVESKESAITPSSELTQDEKNKEEDGVTETRKEGETWVEKQNEKEEKEQVPAVSDIRESGDIDREEEDKGKDLPEEKQEDGKSAIKSKEPMIKPSKLTQDVKSKEDGVKEMEKDGETLEEKKETKPEERDKKEPPPLTPEKTKDEDVAKEREDQTPPTEETKLEEGTDAVKLTETVMKSSKLTQDVKTKEEDEVNETAKEEETMEEEKGTKQEEKRDEKKALEGLLVESKDLRNAMNETPPLASEKTKEEDVANERKGQTPPSEDAANRGGEFEETEELVKVTSEVEQDVTKNLDKEEVKEMGTEEDVIEEKTEGEREDKRKKETSPVSPQKANDEDVRQKENISPSTKDKSEGDVEPSEPTDEVTPEEEKETEEGTNREVRFSAPAELFFEDENKDWKPRGKGQFQILFDKENKNYQVEMKRDRDNSFCVKHPITKEMQLVPVRGMDRSYTWAAMDSSYKEGFLVSTVFAVRFENRETANNFQDEFQKAQTPVVGASPSRKGKDKKESEKEKDKRDNSSYPSDPSLQSSQSSLSPSQASPEPLPTSSHPEDASQSPGGSKSPKDAGNKKPKKKKKKKKKKNF